MSTVQEEASKFEALVRIERDIHYAKGYTLEHDEKEGMDHLYSLCYYYTFVGQPVKAASMLMAIHALHKHLTEQSRT